MIHKAINILSNLEKERIKECLLACVDNLQDPDTHTFIGLPDEELKIVIENWPSNCNDSITFLAVNNCLNLLIHGWDLPWKELGINESYQKIRALFKQLRQN